VATVKKRGNAYKITVSLGYDVKGKQVRRHMTYTPELNMTTRQIEKELERKRVLFEEECNSGIVSCGRAKFEVFARQWFDEYAEPKLKTTTIKGYHDCEKRVYTAIGHLYMNKITTRTIQKFILNLSEDGVNLQTGGGMSPKSVKNYLSFISSIFNYAIKQGVTSSNPCRGVELPTIQQVERDCYTLEEAQQFLSLLEDNAPEMWRVFCTLAIFSGLRRGELFGLEWGDIDFETGVISVQRASLYTKEKGLFTNTPKTKSSIRFLKMPENVIDMLGRYQISQNLERLKIGSKWINSNRLFVGWNGESLNPNSARNWVERFCKRNNIRVVNIHSFRHLNASLLINAGTDIKTVSAALGHKQVSTTLNIYAHTFAASQARAADAIANVLELRQVKAKSS